MMVYNTQDYWVFGLCPSFGFLKISNEHISVTGSVSILKWGVKDAYSVGSIRQS
jgi:hypothetical protein